MKQLYKYGHHCDMHHMTSLQIQTIAHMAIWSRWVTK